jgi:hypothetical protein
MNAAPDLRPTSVVASAPSIDDQQPLSDLIGLTYDAAVNPSLWRSTIERVPISSAVPQVGLFARTLAPATLLFPTIMDFRGCRSLCLNRFIQPLSRTFSETSHSRLRPTI